MVMTYVYRLIKAVLGLILLVGITPTISFAIQDATLTPSRLIYGDSSTKLDSVENLCDWIYGTALRLSCTDNLDGTVTLDVIETGLDHGLLDPTSLTHDDHPGYLWGLGRTGDQTLIGSIDSGGSLTLQSTSHATKGLINLGDTAYINESTGNVGISTTTPGSNLPSGFAAHADARVLEIRSASSGRNAGIFIRNSTGTPGLDLWYRASDGNVYIDSRKNLATSGTYFRTRTAGTPVITLFIKGDGSIGIGTITPTAKLHIDTSSAATIGQIIQLAAAQTANALEVQDSATNILASIDKDGGLETEGNREKKEILIVFGDSPYTVLPNDHIINCDSDGGAIEIDYPAGTSGRELTIKGVGASGNDCTLDPNGAEEIFAGGAGVAFVMHDGEVFDTHYNLTKGWR